MAKKSRHQIAIEAKIEELEVWSEEVSREAAGLKGDLDQALLTIATLRAVDAAAKGNGEDDEPDS